MVIYNDTYCIYAHINKNNGKIYIGQTRQDPEKRWDKGRKYKKCPLFYKAIKKYGWDGFDHEIIASHLTSNEADKFEKFLIKQLQTDNSNFGYNIEPGGNTNKNISDDTKRKMSNSHIGVIYPSRRGKPLSEEHKVNISKSRKGQFVGESHPLWGKTHSQETKDKMSEAKYKAIYCEELNITFYSVQQAASFIGICYTGITACCHGRQKTAGRHPITGQKLTWKFV